MATEWRDQGDRVRQLQLQLRLPLSVQCFADATAIVMQPAAWQVEEGHFGSVRLDRICG